MNPELLLAIIALNQYLVDVPDGLDQEYREMTQKTVYEALDQAIDVFSTQTFDTDCDPNAHATIIDKLDYPDITLALVERSIGQCFPSTIEQANLCLENMRCARDKITPAIAHWVAV